MMNLVQSYPDIMQVAGDLIIKNLDWAGSDVISERMKKMLPPQLQEPEKGQQSPDQAAQQAQQQMEQMANQMEHMSQEIARLSDDKDIKILELYIKRFDAETKRIKTIADIEAGTAPGIEPTTLEIEAHVNQMLNDEHARELAINQEIHKQHMDLNPPQPQMQESPQREATESVQEPQAIEQEEAMQ
jgi:hypothetical protein